MSVPKLKIAARTILIAAGLLSAGGMGTHPLPAALQSRLTAGAPEERPVTVSVFAPKKGDRAHSTYLAAEVVAAQQQQIAPLISGTVQEVAVDLGDHVKKGQVLIVLEAPLALKEVEQTMALLEMAQAQVKEAEAQIVIAEAEVESATMDLKRFESSEGAITAGKIAAARLEVKVKQARLSRAKASVKSAQAKVKSCQVAVDRARLQAELTRLKAAFDGVVTRRTIDPGNFVQPSDSRLLTPLLTLQRIDPLRVVAEVPGCDAPFIAREDPVDLVFDALPGVRMTDQKVSRLSPVLHGTEKSMTVEIDLANPDKRLMPGMIARMTIHFSKTRSAKSFTVPASCLVVQPLGTVYRNGRTFAVKGKAFLYIVREGKAHRTAVEPVFPVPLGEGEAEIVEGLKASDQIVADPKKLQGDVVPVEVTKTP